MSPTVQVTNPASTKSTITNRFDTVELSQIVNVRDALIAMQSRGEQVYRLESGTPAFNLFPEVAEAIVRAIRENKTFYTEASGIAPLRARIVEKLQRRNGVIHEVTPNNVFVGQGGMGTLYCLINALASQGETALTPVPVWISITAIAHLAGARVVEVPLREDLEFNWDFDEFADAVRRERPKFVIVVNPGNPTGGIYPKADVVPLLELVKECGFYVIEDLAYEDIIYDDDFVVLTGEAHATGDPDIYRKFIPCFSMSKSQNYSGLRIGYTHIIDEEIATRFRKALLYTTNGVNSIVQWGAIEALDAKHDGRLKEMAQGYRERRDILAAGLEQAGVFRLPGRPKGAFYLFPHIDRAKLIDRLGADAGVPATDDPTPLGEWLAEYLLKSGIGSIAGHHFGACAAENIRFSYTCSLDDARAVAGRLVEMFAE